MIIDGLGQPRSYSGNLLQISHCSAQHSSQTPKVCQQRPAPGRPETRHRLKHRFAKPPCAAAPVPGDREAMRLVTNALDQVQHRAVGRQLQRMPIARQVQPFLTYAPVGPLRD